MIGQFKMNPWVRGFQPPGTKCPNCKKIGTLVFTGNYTDNGDQIYKCMNSMCNSLIGSPTMHAWCDRFGCDRWTSGQGTY